MTKNMTQFLQRIIIIVTLLIAAIGPTWAQEQQELKPLNDIKVSLITFYPGDEVFEVFGHSEILVTDATHKYYFN